MSEPSGDKKNTEGNPGAGWTNGDVPPAMRVLHNATLQRFGERRWLTGLSQGWTRIGSGHEHDAVTSTSKNIGAVQSIDPVAIKCLIAQLCEFFYRQGWATGTGGGCSIRVRDDEDDKNGTWRVFVAPSGIQKEDMIWQDIFELDMDRHVTVPPITPGLRQSACTPLWYVVYKHRPNATCVIHTHSMAAVQATLIDENATSLDLTHLEMLKGVGGHAYDDLLQVPIIDNRPTEDLLADQLEAAVIAYPKCNAALVRRHGLYVWGDSWEQAKCHAESFDYLFTMAVAMHQMGVDCSKVPDSSSSSSSSANKKRKLPVVDHNNNGFHGKSAVDNALDCRYSNIPLLPRDSHISILLLDIEGCTTSISFVKDVLFPYCRQIFEAKDDNNDSLLITDEEQAGLQREVQENGGDPTGKSATDLALHLMDRDVKSATLKSLQGRLWQSGYESGQLQGHVYADLVPAVDWMNQHGIKVCIYSSGSVQAQKLLFGHSLAGNLCGKLHAHFDIPTAGSKKESMSYQNIAQSLGVAASKICFVSDVTEELAAARSAGLGAAVLSIRPGNAPVDEQDKQDYPVIHSLLQLCGAE